ncbi:MAG: guanylate cyclase, partial [Spirulina sp. SIO3F2]|nr:guanylate cyclase [Spirulina sp. SIO3F2]
SELRMKFIGYLVVAIVVSGLIYPLFGHWVWGGLVGNQPEAMGWLRSLGFYDFAGSTVVNSVGAWVSLAALLVIGPRAGRFQPGQPSQKIHGSYLPLSVMGTLLLWFGWLGFNGGSLLTFSPVVAQVLVHTLLAGVAGMVVAGILSWFKRHLLEVELLIYGSLAGLVAISASCNVVSTPIAVIIGGVGGAVMLLVWEALEHWHIDDAVGAVAVHAGGGVWGTLAVGLFAQPEVLGTGLSKGSQIAVQLLGIGICFVWAFGVSWLVLKGIDRLTPLRVSPEEEDLGLNVAEHGAKTELYELLRVMEAQAQTQDLSLRVPVEAFTEVGHIASRYNRVMQALETQHQRLQKVLSDLQKTQARLVESDQTSQRLLLNILPSPIVDRLKTNPDTIAESFEEVTVLFADLVGFTEMASRLSPIELVERLNVVFSAFDQLSEEHQLEKIKTIGDAYMVVGGLPTPRADHAMAIAEMALDMQRVIDVLNHAEREEQFRIRIGINTGSVVAGVIGTKKFIYDLWGDTVNIASRMESHGLPGQIQVTEATYVKLNHHYQLTPRDKIMVKGKGEMQTYWLKARSEGVG